MTSADVSPPGPPRVFINYRRDDASGHAGRLYDALSARFGAERVFMDVDAIRPGENFATVLDHSVGNCDVLIALIGRRWVTAVDREGRRRLERPEDYVRLELQTALASTRTRVIPALVQGAEMPSSDDLPEPMRALAMRQAIELSDVRWRGDVERLIRELEGAPPQAGTSAFDRVPPTTPPARPAPAQRGRRHGVLAVAFAALVAGAAAIAVVVSNSGGPGSGAARGGGSTQGSLAANPSPTRTTTPAKTATPTATASVRKTTGTAIRYRPYSTQGYQAQIPAGGDWSRPAQTSYSGGRRVRTIVQSRDGSFVAVDFTPLDKPTFSAPYDSKTSVVFAAFGPATKYVFHGGTVAQCDRWRCVDYQLSIPDTPGGLGVVAGGPDFGQTSEIARTVAQSLTPPSSG